MIYAVFTTPRNSISANAICAFRIRDLLDTFEGAFKEQETANSNWLPVPKIKEPVPRYVNTAESEKKIRYNLPRYLLVILQMIWITEWVVHFKSSIEPYLLVSEVVNFPPNVTVETKVFLVLPVL